MFIPSSKYSMDKADYSIVVGDTDQDWNEGEESHHSVSLLLPHHHYDPTVSPGNDIALIKLTHVRTYYHYSQHVTWKQLIY